MTQMARDVLRGLTTLLLAVWGPGCPSSRLPDAEDASTPPSDAYVAPPLPEGWEIFEAYVARATRHCESCALGLDPEIERTRDAVRAGRIGIDAARMSECLRTARLGGYGYAL
ncbi:MAG: hypothetical protein J0L92_41635, partial [Deltaproteobacteria bacterium]|nr:hypothetical protein [Deltaproteobacteria bacterium]